MGNYKPFKFDRKGCNKLTANNRDVYYFFNTGEYKTTANGGWYGCGSTLGGITSKCLCNSDRWDYGKEIASNTVIEEAFVKTETQCVIDENQVRFKTGTGETPAPCRNIPLVTKGICSKSYNENECENWAQDNSFDYEVYDNSKLVYQITRGDYDTDTCNEQLTKQDCEDYMNIFYSSQQTLSDIDTDQQPTGCSLSGDIVYYNYHGGKDCTTGTP